MTTYAYNANSQVTSITDENGNVTTFSYPSNTQSYAGVCNAWDNINHCWSYSFDISGTLLQILDPNGYQTLFTKDGLNRFTKINYNYQNTSGDYTSYTYDAGNRVTQTIDSSAGTTTRKYDDLDELSIETLGSTVGYCYDPAGRRSSATMGAQTLSYSYDTGDNLKFVSQGSGNQGAQMAYDAAGRLTATFMPYNSWEYYFYDPASNIQWIEEYNNGTGSGNNTGKYLNYTYDADEQRVAMSGTLASVTLPTSMTASYGVGNQLLKYNSGTQNVSYDQNGNMTNDPSFGIGNLKYNARDQLISASMGPIGGPYTSVYNFTYDDLGRRLTQGVTGGNTETYIYDGANIAFSTTSGSGVFSPFAIFQGLDLDDFFSIAINGNTLGSGGQAVLHDSLGSTTATETSGGTISGTYQYGPFGTTSIGSGSPAAGPMLYSGRELDPSGLYFMRNRYYSPGLQRFAAPDPLGFGGGDANLYAYVGNSPVNATDNTGLLPCDAAACGEDVIPPVSGLPGDSPPFLNVPQWTVGPSAVYQGMRGQGLGGGVLEVTGASTGQQIAQIYDGDENGLVVDGAKVAGQIVSEAGEDLELSVGEYRYTRTAGAHQFDINPSGKYKGELVRPYMKSPETINEIVATGKGVPDPGGQPGAVRYDVPGKFHGKPGTGQLVVDPVSKIIYHFLFKGDK